MCSWNSHVQIDRQRKPAKLLIHVRGPGGKGMRGVTLNSKQGDAFYGNSIIVPAPLTKISIMAVHAQ
jgi:hypothetical protein